MSAESTVGKNMWHDHSETGSATHKIAEHAKNMNAGVSYFFKNDIQPLLSEWQIDSTKLFEKYQLQKLGKILVEFFNMFPNNYFANQAIHTIYKKIEQAIGRELTVEEEENIDEIIDLKFE